MGKSSANQMCQAAECLQLLDTESNQVATELAIPYVSIIVAISMKYLVSLSRMANTLYNSLFFRTNSLDSICYLKSIALLLTSTSPKFFGIELHTSHMDIQRHSLYSQSQCCIYQKSLKPFSPPRPKEHSNRPIVCVFCLC